MQPLDFDIFDLTDSYKDTHWLQYPPETTGIFSYEESRGGEFDQLPFFGLQYFLMRYLCGQVVNAKNMDKAIHYTNLHFGNDTLFHRDGWARIRDFHNGHLPIEIRALPEGTVVRPRTPMFTVESTDRKLPWITNFVEGLLSQVWYPTSVCALSRANKEVLLHYLKYTGSPSLIYFKLHDFGFRGSTSPESAAIGGAAHLVNFMGTDTKPALKLLREFYSEEMAGHSIPAAEHSTITAWGRQRETEAYRHMLSTFPDGLVAVVSDSYDIYNACENIWGGELREQVLGRNGTLVIRPDSGDPAHVLPTILDKLWDAFGGETNQNSYRVLNPKVRVIQGDGINKQSLKTLLTVLQHHGWSADNVAFGSGGGLLQKVDRDSGKFAYKCSAVRYDGDDWLSVCKDPITDPGKKSKQGRLSVIKNGRTGEYGTVEGVDPAASLNEMVPVFRNGVMLSTQTFQSIRDRAKVGGW